MQNSHDTQGNSTRFNQMFRSPTRISITLPYNTYQELIRKSDDEGRSMSNLAAFLLEVMLRKRD
jgi:hypothetical protein